MNVEVNWLAVVLATISSMVVGFIWYSPQVFGDKWSKLVKLDLKKVKSADANKAIGVTIVVSLITAYILAHVAFLSNSFFHHSFMQDAVVTAFWAWLGFTATRFITHDAFEQRPMQLTALNIAHEFVTLMIMGVIIGAFPPA